MIWNPQSSHYTKPSLVKCDGLYAPVSEPQQTEGAFEPVAADQFSYAGKGKPMDAQTRLAAVDAADMAAQVDPQTSLETLGISQLREKDVSVHVRGLDDAVPLGGRYRQVNYKDLLQNDLLPKMALQVESLKKPILFSQFISLGYPKKRCCIMYAPSYWGEYIPRPIYQSVSHGAWQAPNYIERLVSNNDAEFGLGRFGKGLGKRGKTETALCPELQMFLAAASLKQQRSLPATADQQSVWAGVAQNVKSFSWHYDHYSYNRSVKLEELYKGKGAHIHSLSEFPMDASQIKIPTEAKPDFKQPEMMYSLHNQMYGDMQAEVYPSRDGKLLWTVYIQKETQRAWVAHAHAKNGKLTETGLHQQLINIGENISLAPYAYEVDMEEAVNPGPLTKISGMPYVDIWEKYTSKNPLIQDYYKAKGLTCPK